MQEYTVRDWQHFSSTQETPHIELSYDFYHSEIANLKAQVNQFQQYIYKLEEQFKEKNKRLQVQLDEQILNNRQLKQQILTYEQQLQQSAFRQKLLFSGQLETLINELDQLTSLMNQKSERIVQLEFDNQALLNQIYELETSIEQQQFQYDHFDQQNIFILNQVDQLKQEKNELIIKLNDSQIMVQKLAVELQCKSSQLLENNKQNQLQEQIRDEITKAQMTHQEQFIKLLQQEIIELKEQLKNK
ncbi:unnamed protein product (macronuclear) [Paramecium tetraurelia]|uniref:Uncharacterized protein n=1 Tax=Paramecium tetraurelia TaxID=5888 RepID=A0C1R5_PARTE|nr:uncharacterized protein GSPATT00034209001 [Paramecium tetraurelia]CAK64732.1 unnamed protein product [Paramecium tetraurelia]|eukprot:XP_001432129.1 hypothetical protein (macronuclear) [Paramecium tetraurelia strain d4-2]